MKPSIKLYTMLLTLCVAIFTACVDEAKYAGAENPSNAQVYFSNKLPPIIELASSSNSFEVELRRVDAKETLTVALVSDADITLFMIPNSVIFAAGEQSAMISITYNPEAFEFDAFKSIKLSISDNSLTSIYGNTEYMFQAGIPAPWESMGIATFSENFWYEATVKVELQRHMIDPTRYRLVEPFTAIIDLLIEEGEDLSANNKGTQSKYLEFKINPVGSTITGVTTTVEGLVSYSDINIGYYHTSYNDDIYMMHPSRFTSYSSESFWLHNIVTQFSDDGQPEVVQLAPYYYIFNVGGWNNTQNDNTAVIVFPGVVVADYSAEVTYLGRFTNTEKVDYAVGNVTFGADVTSVKVAMIEGSDINTAVAAIANGTLQATEMSASGQFSFPCEANGTYSFVVVTYDSEEDKRSASVTFRFTLSQGGDDGSEWTSLGTGAFLDAFLFEDTYPVEIQQNKADPNTYRLVDPYTPGLTAEGYIPDDNQGSQAEYVEFTILPVGSILNNVTTTIDGLVFYNEFSTGFFHPNYKEDVFAVHPSKFSNMASESFWQYNTVKQKSNTGKPEIVQLAPLYYLFGEGAGWNFTQQNDIVTIGFPGISSSSVKAANSSSVRKSAIIKFAGRMQRIVNSFDQLIQVN